mgnify:CR=1 FL=1
MTKITYFEDGDEISVDISGHAGYAKKDMDIVCSAISMLACTLLNYLSIDSDEFNYIQQEGHVWANAKGTNVPTAFHVIMTGYHLLEDNYPEHIEVARGCCMQRSP